MIKYPAPLFVFCVNTFVFALSTVSAKLYKHRFFSTNRGFD